jgi:predicted DNA-binding transcriptional regulator YafY
LAAMLETKPRNIIEFKKELENAGYIIESTTGKYGGYSLKNTAEIQGIKLTEEDKWALTQGIEYLRARNDFVFKNEFNLAIAKIFSNQKGLEESQYIKNRVYI